jgi:hypothetical protein
MPEILTALRTAFSSMPSSDAAALFPPLVAAVRSNVERGRDIFNDFLLARTQPAQLGFLKHVGFWGQSGNVVLTLRFTAFDPTATSPANCYINMATSKVIRIDRLCPLG